MSVMLYPCILLCCVESRLCVFRELCPVSFLVVGENLSVLL